MIYFCYFLLGFLIIRLLVAIVNYLSFSFVSKETSISNDPKISILIPARNEEETIGGLLEPLSAIKYDKLEIIVYNDQSTDQTGPIVQQWASIHSRIKLIHGEALPKGWLGKNHACHQLAVAADGEILLFLDADVQIKEAIIQRSIHHLQKNQLHLLSIFPKQLMDSFGERVSVPLMNWILLSLLPLFLIKRTKNKDFSAANGQFMMFDARSYKDIWPHKECKQHKVEDIATLRLFKQKGLHCDTRLGDNDISCRMYRDLGAAVEGFTKSIFEFFGNSILATIIFGVLTTIAPFVIFLEMGVWWFMTYFIGVVSIRIFVSLASNQSVIQNIVLALPQHFVFLIIILKGLINKKQKRLLWKGRNILEDQ